MTPQTERADVLISTMDISGRAISALADTCSPGGLREMQWLKHLEKHDELRDAMAELIAAVRDERHAYIKPYIDALKNGTGIVDMASYVAARERVDAALDRIGSAT